MSVRRVAIVGGGISGLALAEALIRKSTEAGQPADVVVLESEDAPGGKIRSTVERGFVVETGPHGFLDKEPEIFALTDRLGLERDLIRADEASAKRYVVRGGKLRMVPMKPPQFLFSDILPFFAKVRVGMEPFAKGPPGTEETVWDFAARRIGRTAADVLVDAMVTGVYGGDPKALSLRSAFPRMHELESLHGGLLKAQLAVARERKALASGEPPREGQPSQAAVGQPTGSLHSYRRGLGQLTSALAERVRIECGVTVEALDRREDPHGFRIRGGGQVIDADAVIMTTPAFVTSRVLAPHLPAIAEHFDAIPYSDISVVVQCFSADAVARGLDGFGFLAPHIEGRQVLGSICASTVFPAHAPDGAVMFRTLLGGTRNPAAAEGSDRALFDRARAELTALGCVPQGASPTLERVIRWPRGIPQYTLGHSERVAAADALESQLPGLFVCGNGFRGVALLACVADAQRVAERVLSHLARASR